MQWVNTAPDSSILKIWRRVEDRGFQVFPLSSPFEDYKPCIVSTYRADSRGNVQVCFNEHGGKIHVMVHVLSYVYHNKTKIEQYNEVSHLCHRHQCCEPTHLVLESPKQNHSRKNCIGFVWTAKYKDWIRVCEHSPICLTSRIPSW